MNVMVMNFTNEGWTLEFEDGAIMNQGASEHIKEAAEVCLNTVILSLSELCRISGQGKDNAETVMAGFFKICYRSCCKYGRATGHPLQSLADAITMEEFKTDHRPKVVLSWAPHQKHYLKLSPILLCK
jgi:N-succinyl-L-ornithine transcarbamylase